jgi:hypothetical protein
MTELQYNKKEISIQVGLSGYSFKVYSGDSVETSGWMTPDRLFSAPQMQKRYDEVSVSIFTPKFALVPTHFYNAADAKTMLSEVAEVTSEDVVEAVAVPQFAAVLLYSDAAGGSLSRVIAEMVLRTDGSKARPLPEVYYMLSSLEPIAEYNKIVASYIDGYLYLVIAQGRTLLLCNAYAAQDFTTAEYFLFLALKKLQLNPEVSTVYFRTPLGEEEEMSLYRYFKNVEQI